jgi:hypothetical protein
VDSIATVLTPHFSNHSTSSSKSLVKAPNFRTGAGCAPAASSGTQTQCEVAPTSMPAACGWITGSCRLGCMGHSPVLVWPPSGAETFLAFMDLTNLFAGLSDPSPASGPLLIALFQTG